MVCAAKCGLLNSVQLVCSSAADVQIPVPETAETVVRAYEACHLAVAKDHVALIANSCNWQRYLAAMKCMIKVVVSVNICHGPMCD